MDFLQQAIELLSEPPGSVIYHLVTLFALQIVFAIAYSRWRKDPEDSQALRFIWASGAIFLGRMVLLIIGLINSNNPQQVAILMPPLEQAINTITISLIVWALIPHPQKAKRILDILLVSVIVISGILYLFFAQDWVNQIESGVTFYNETVQATVWTIMQIVILVLGFSYTLLKIGLQEMLPALIFLILIFSSVANLFNQIEFVPTDTNVTYFIRLGLMIALPLWAVYAYQYTIEPLLQSESSFMKSAGRYKNGLENAAEIISTSQNQARIVKSLKMTSELSEADFVALGLVDRQNPFQMQFVTDMANGGTSEYKEFIINLNQQSAFTLALTQGNTIELLPEGIGARQLYDFYHDAKIEPKGSILIQPLSTDERRIGLLLVGAPSERKVWSKEIKELLPGLAKFLAQAIQNSQRPTELSIPVSARPEPREDPDTVPSAILIDQVRLHGLKAERDELQMALDKAKLETKQAQARALAAQKQARYLAAALKAAQMAAKQKPQNEADVDTVVTSKRNSQTVPRETSES